MVEPRAADRRGGDGAGPPRAHGLDPRGRRLVRAGGVPIASDHEGIPSGACPARAPPSEPRPTSARRGAPADVFAAWSIDSFARSLSSLSDHTVAAYASDVRGFATWAARAGIERAGRREAHQPAPLPGVPHDPRVRPAQRRPQGRGVPALLQVARAGRPPRGRPDGRAAGPRWRRTLAAGPRAPGSRGAARGSPARGRAGLAPPTRRRRAGGAVRLGPAGQRAVRPERRLAGTRRGRGRRLGQGRQAAPGSVVGAGRGGAAQLAGHPPRGPAPRTARRPRSPCSSATSGARR